MHLYSTMYGIELCVHTHVCMHTWIGNHQPPYMMKELTKQHDQIHGSDLQPQPGYRTRHMYILPTNLTILPQYVGVPELASIGINSGISGTTAAFCDLLYTHVPIPVIP